jgi:hypothetical protein
VQDVSKGDEQLTCKTAFIGCLRSVLLSELHSTAYVCGKAAGIMVPVGSVQVCIQQDSVCSN